MPFNWFDRTENTSVLNVDGAHVATIKKRKEGNLPFYFSQKIEIITYSGNFKTMSSAKKHVERKLRDFARAVEADQVLANWNDEGVNRLLKIGEETRSSITELQKSINGEYKGSAITYISDISKKYDEILKRCDEAEKIHNDILKKKA